VIIDEGGTHRTEVLQYLINDVLGPALTDNDGQLILTGTPGPIPRGFFHDITTLSVDKGGWKTHKWSVQQNPHHPFGRDPAALEAYRIERGLALTDPTWLREFRGLWALDTEALIYRYDPERNCLSDTATEPTLRVLSLDLGYDDDAAFVVTESTRGVARIIVREATSEKGLLTRDYATRIQQLQARYRLDRIVGDSGGLAKTIITELRQVYRIPIVAAEKTEKAAWIRSVQGALRSGALQLAAGAMGLIEEWEILPWDDNRKGHAEGFPDHKSDALLYGYRCHPRIDVPIEPVAPATGSEEWSRREATRLREAAAQRSMRRRR
jgi:hypothetical protein